MASNNEKNKFLAPPMSRAAGRRRVCADAEAAQGREARAGRSVPRRGLIRATRAHELYARARAPAVEACAQALFG